MLCLSFYPIYKGLERAVSGTNGCLRGIELLLPNDPERVLCPMLFPDLDGSVTNLSSTY